MSPSCHQSKDRIAILWMGRADWTCPANEGCAFPAVKPCENGHSAPKCTLPCSRSCSELEPARALGVSQPPRLCLCPYLCPVSLSRAVGASVAGPPCSLPSFCQEGLGHRELHLPHLASKHEREGHQESHQLPPEEEPGSAGPSAEGSHSAPGVLAASSPCVPWGCSLRCPHCLTSLPFAVAARCSVARVGWPVDTLLPAQPEPDVWVRHPVLQHRMSLPCSACC